MATTDSKHADPIAPNLLKRDFSASRPDEVWVGDVTAIATLEGWFFLAVLIDLHSRRVVGWSASSTNDRHLSPRCARKSPPNSLSGPRTHCSQRSREPLRQRRLPQGVGRDGRTPEHEPQRRLLGQCGRGELLLQRNDRASIRQPIASFRVAQVLLAEYIDCFYNRVRLHSTAGYTSPVAYELKSRAATLAA